jgi:hypothetical protein
MFDLGSAIAQIIFIGVIIIIGGVIVSLLKRKKRK